MAITITWFDVLLVIFSPFTDLDGYAWFVYPDGHSSSGSGNVYGDFGGRYSPYTGVYGNYACYIELPGYAFYGFGVGSDSCGIYYTKIKLGASLSEDQQRQQ